MYFAKSIYAGLGFTFALLSLVYFSPLTLQERTALNNANLSSELAYNSRYYFNKKQHTNGYRHGNYWYRPWYNYNKGNYYYYSNPRNHFYYYDPYYYYYYRGDGIYYYYRV